MLRPNYAMDPPPTKLQVGGGFYQINTDYRAWLEVLRLMKDITADTQDPQLQQKTIDAVERMQEIIFGGILADEDINDVLSAIFEFSKGYPGPPVNGEPEDGPARFSFDYDLNYIIIAIRNQSGIDLSYRRKEPFHWWEFLLEFNTLAGDHYILNLMDARGYKGKDKDALRRKRMYALPVEYTAAEQAEIDAFNAMFEEGF